MPCKQITIIGEEIDLNTPENKVRQHKKNNQNEKELF